jgi:Flp pilus assembly protein TadG
MRGRLVIAQPLSAASRRRHKNHLDRGAAAVEMAIVLPLLLFILMAMIDFGRGFNAQIQLSQAAREGVRLASLNPGTDSAGQISDANYGTSAITTRVKNAAGGVGGVTATVTYCPIPASATDTATVVVTSPFTWITGISSMSKLFGVGTFPQPAIIRAAGVMRCAG